ncbi:MAG: SulP family inorganic anion transporter [Verrucomicrobiia bacterium]|jgi:SulP family sulfate permease
MLDLFAKRAASSKNDILSGITVALALVPEAIAFAFVAGVPPHLGLYSAVIVGLITAIFGGRPGMISGATGAMAVVIVGLVAIHGISYLIPAVILCGIFQVGVGLCRLGKLIRLVPHSVMLGFVNGLAIVICMSQFGSFKTFAPDGSMQMLGGAPLTVMCALVALTMAIIAYLPKFTKAVPSSLAAILVVSGLSLGINRFAGDRLEVVGSENSVLTVQDMLLSNLKAKEVERAQVAKMARAIESAKEGAALIGTDLGARNGNPSETAAYLQLTPEEISAAAGKIVEVPQAGVPLPVFFQKHFKMPPLNFETLQIIFPFALILAGVGLIESLMTLTLIDEITGTRGRGNRECVGQGAANIVCGIFGGMGGCAMIGQSLINVNSGGRGRLSGVVAALSLLLFVVALQPFILMIPMAALVGVMFMVVIGTFEWSTLNSWKKIPVYDVLVMILVAGYTVLFHNLAMAVLLGVIVQALVFAWNHATHLFVDKQTNEHGSRIYQLHGPLFFASAASFSRLFDIENDPDDVVIDFYYTRVYDQSGLEAISKLSERYRALNKRLHLRHLSGECLQLLDRAEDLVEVNVSEDPHYHVATDRLA